MYVVSIEAVVAVVSVGKGFLADHFEICETYRHWEAQEARLKLIFDLGVSWTKERTTFLREERGRGELVDFLGQDFFWSQLACK